VSPRISVVLPAYRAEATLGAAIASILAQTEPDFELIIVDDGMGGLAARAADLDPRIRVVSFATNRGIVQALNAGLEAARGELIARMDADDLAHPERLAKQRAFLDARPELGLVGCLVAHAGDTGGQVETVGDASGLEKNAPDTRGYALYVDWLNGLVTPEAIALGAFVESPFAHPSVMFRRTLVEAHGGYRAGDFPEDYELWLRWLAAGVRMGKVPEVLLTWRDRPDRLSRTDPRCGIEALYRLKAPYLAAWLKARGHHDIVLWGAGKTSRQRAAALEAEGIRIVGFIDVDPRRTHSRDLPITYCETLGGPAGPFVVSYAGKRGGSAIVRACLAPRGWVEGVDYLIAA